MKKTTGELQGIEDTVKGALADTFGSETLEVRRVEMVGPKVGEDLRRKGMLAVLFHYHVEEYL